VHTYGWLAILWIASTCVPSTAQTKRATARIPTEYEKLYEQLVQLRIDESKVANVSELMLVRDVGVFQLQKGQLYGCNPVNKRVVAVLFIGEGSFSMKPPTQVERQQLFRFFEKDSIEMSFKTLFLFFADTTWEELNRRVSLGPASNARANEELKYCLRYLHDEDTKIFHTNFMYTFLHDEMNPLFYAHFSEHKIVPFFFQNNPFEDEEISFSKRGESTVHHYRERVSQFDTQREYQSGTAGKSEDKNLIRITDYRIDATITDDLEFSASATVLFQPVRQGLRWIPFQLYEKLNVDTTYWRIQGTASYFRGNESPVLWVQAPHPLARNEVCSLTVRYAGDLLERNELGWIGLQSSSIWYPRFGYRMRANFDLTFHTPERWQFASVGKKQYARLIQDTLVSRWTTVRPAHNASFSIGPFREVMLEDNHFAAERQAEESLPNVSVLEFEYAPKGYGLSDLAEEVRSDILNCMRFFQHVYGKSPVEDIFVTETPYFHGEAFPGLIDLSWATYKIVDRKGGNEIFRAHEVAHQWWGVGVNFKTYHDQWLSEGISEYSGLWYMQAALNDNEKFFNALDNMKERILNNRKFLFGSGQESGPIWLGIRTQSSNTEGDYDLIVYKKGAWVVHMLRNMMIDLNTMNEDRFKNMMREFYSLYLGKEASTDDFQHIVEKHIGANMGWFFHQWVMETTIPEYSFSYSTMKTPDGKFKTRCRVHQQCVPKEFMMPIPLLIKFDDGRFVRLRIVVSGEKQEYELPLLPLEPKEIVFNDLNSVLCEVSYEDWK